MTIYDSATKGDEERPTNGKCFNIEWHAPAMTGRMRRFHNDMTLKNVSLKGNAELYDKYREFCKKKEQAISRNFEIMIEEQIGGIINDAN